MKCLGQSILEWTKWNLWKLAFLKISSGLVCFKFLEYSVVTYESLVHFFFSSLKASHNSVETLQSNAKNFRGHSFSKYYNWGTPIEIIADVKNSLKIN